MKVNYQGGWKGLVRASDCRYEVDYYSSPDKWQIGFDIVYRLIFIPNESDIVSSRIQVDLKQAFREPFGMAADHFETADWTPGDSVFWRIYWDKQSFNLSLLDQCEKAVNRCAEENNIMAIIIGMMIIPRSLSHIEELVKLSSQ